MSAVQIAMIARLPYTAFRDAILTHPTLAEGIGALFSSEPSVPMKIAAPVNVKERLIPAVKGLRDAKAC
jgi:hypothetical protein